jgi:hypothetical protein
VGNHHNARAFEDLAEFLDHFLFLGSIHSSTPGLRGLPLGSHVPGWPGVRVLNEGPEKIAREHGKTAPQKTVSTPSQEGH